MTRCRSTLTCLLLFAVLMQLAAPIHLRAQDWTPPLQLQVGEQTLLSADGVESFSEGKKGVVDVRLTPDATHFLVVGLANGQTSLLLLYRDGRERQVRIHVGDTRPHAGNSTSDAPQVSARDNIRLELYFIQVSDDYNHQIGLQWPTSLSPGFALNAQLDLATGDLAGATATIAGELLPQLDFAQATGWAKVMHRTALITTNGAEASFGGGGELNVKVLGGFGGSLQKITYGSKVTVMPRYDRSSGRMELQITASVADLASDGGTGVPGRKTSDLQTVVNLSLGEAVILAGLDSLTVQTSRSGLPGLSQIPILGALFGGHSESQHQTKNLLCVIPTVVESVDQEARLRLQDALAAFEEFSGDTERFPDAQPGLQPEESQP